MDLLLIIIRRIAIGIVTVLVVSLLVFAGTELLPGNIAQAILGQGATPEAIANINVRLGLDLPAHTRYINWFSDLLQGDMGTSLVSGREVSTLIAERGGNTFLLAAVTALVAVPLSVLLGLIACTRPNGLVDKTISAITLTLISIPDFLVAVILVSIFSVHLGWLPALSSIRPDSDFFELARMLALPVTALSFTVMAHMVRMTRTAVLNELTSPAIEMGILKGVPKSRLLLVHAMSNAIAPIVNVIALNLAYLISGVVVIETLFNLNGLGKLMVQAVATRDIPLVQGCAMLFCAVYVILNLFADTVSMVANPRIRHPK
jgi:peptide/nickel transport system permease protein